MSLIFIYIIFVEIGGHFSAFIGINMGRNCAASLSIFSFTPSKQKGNIITVAKTFNLTFRNIGNVLSINNPNFANWIPLIFPKEVEIKETLKIASSAQTFLDIYLKFDTNVQLSTRSSDKRDNFNFAIIKFPHSYAKLELTVCIQTSYNVTVV